MPALTRTEVVAALENGWGTYAARFAQLGPEAQAGFLRAQGYARLGDLLAHVIFWFDNATGPIERLLAGEDYHNPSFDVDAENARAVERYRDRDDAQVVQIFEARRRALLVLAQRLPDSAFADERIADRFRTEVTGHLQEHDVPHE